jgi:hypothetical protein
LLFLLLDEGVIVVSWRLHQLELDCCVHELVDRPVGEVLA